MIEFEDKIALSPSVLFQSKSILHSTGQPYCRCCSESVAAWFFMFVSESCTYVRVIVSAFFLTFFHALIKQRFVVVLICCAFSSVESAFHFFTSISFSRFFTFLLFSARLQSKDGECCRRRRTVSVEGFSCSF